MTKILTNKDHTHKDDLHSERIRIFIFLYGDGLQPITQQPNNLLDFRKAKTPVKNCERRHNATAD